MKPKDITKYIYYLFDKNGYTKCQDCIHCETSTDMSTRTDIRFHCEPTKKRFGHAYATKIRFCKSSKYFILAPKTEKKDTETKKCLNCKHLKISDGGTYGDWHCVAVRPYNVPKSSIDKPVDCYRHEWM